MIGDCIIYMATLTTMVSVVATDLSRRAVEHVDCVEVNHFHSIQGEPAFTQLILWDWDQEDSAYHVRSWKMIEANEPMPMKQDGRWFVRYHDRTDHLDRVVVCRHGKESWTQNDPERDDKAAWPEIMRQRLVRYVIVPTPEPLTEELPTQWPNE
jgi:hypothetical protein